MKELEELLVIDLSSVLAGPTVGSFFAELGARVIKIEKPGGDVTRSWRLPQESTDHVSAYYAATNYRKEVHFLDLRTAEGKRQVENWLSQADILIENYKHSDRDKFGFSSDELKKRFPRLIHCHLQGFAFELDRVAYDVVLQAETGFMFMNGSSDSGPIKMPVALIDVLAAHQMKEAILLGLYQRERNGQGASFTVSLEASALASLVNQASNYLMTGHIPQPMGTQHPNIAPYGDLYRCGDGKLIVLAIGSDVQFSKLVTYLGNPALSSDPRFLSNAERVKNRPAMNTELGQLIASKEAATLLNWCHKNFVPAGSIRRMDEVCDSALAKKMLLEENQEGSPTKRLSSIAFERN